MAKISCEAEISNYQEIHKSVQRFVTDLNGKTYDLGADTEEKPGIGERTVTCKYCKLAKTLRAEGMGFAPYNETQRQALEFLQKNCQRWARAQEEYEEKAAGPFGHLYSRPQPDSFFPR